jgi:uncharacterized membrane protein
LFPCVYALAVSGLTILPQASRRQTVSESATTAIGCLAVGHTQIRIHAQGVASVALAVAALVTPFILDLTVG